VALEKVNPRVPVAFYNQCGTAEQWIKEGKGAITWTRLSCRTFAANVVRLQLHALAYNLGNFMRTLAMPKAVEPWSLTSLRENKIGAKVVSHGRYVTFQMAEVAASPIMFRDILMLTASGATGTSVRGAGNECDKQGRQGCAMTMAKHHVYAPRGGNPSIPLPAAPIAVRGFCHGRLKTRHGARLFRNPRKKFFLSVNYVTLLDRFLNDAA
jgi:hypothetical protein